ncbi:MAG: hypothetical protein FWF29_06950 [Treponema sp.]|nr:hypothetical protein [Treponema sp.]
MRVPLLSFICLLSAAAMAFAGGVKQPESAGTTVNINTSAPQIRFNSGFSGFNVNAHHGPHKYTDPVYMQFVGGLAPGILRWPGGTTSNAFNWRTGHEEKEWVALFYGNNTFNMFNNYENNIMKKGPLKLWDYELLLRAVNAKLVVTINTFSNTPEEAGELAHFCKVNNIQVEVFNLGNEPYFTSVWGLSNNGSNGLNFYRNGKDYADKVKAYAQAIRAELPDAHIGLVIHDTEARDNNGFTNQLRDYPDKYWNTVNYHAYEGYDYGSANIAPYPNRPAETIQNLNTFLNDMKGIIQDRADKFPGMPHIITESGVNINPNPAIVVDNTLYGALFNAELCTRASCDPHLMYTCIQAIAADRQFVLDHPTDPPYFSLSGYAMQIANQAINSSRAAYVTTVKNSVTVDGADEEKVDAVYAQAYRGDDGKDYLVIINKSGTDQVLTVNMNGKPMSASLVMSSLSGTDPLFVINKASGNRISDGSAQLTQMVPVTNPVTVGPYSVTRIEWQGSASIPEAPRLYKPEINKGSVKLLWSSSAGAQGYTVHYGPAASSLTQTLDVSGATCDISWPDNSTVFFNVTASGSAGSSGPSATLSAKLAAPEIPVLTDAISKDAYATVYIHAVEGAAGYKVMYGPSAGKLGTIVDVGNAPGADIRELANGTEVFFAVCAYNGYGDSGQSNVISCVPTDKRPSPPARARASASLQSPSVTVSANGHTASFNTAWFEFTWNPPYRGSAISGEQAKINADPVYMAEMAKVKGYRIFRSTDPQSGYVKLADVDASVTTYKDSGLTPGKVYYYRIFTLGDANTVSRSGSNILTRY